MEQTVEAVLVDFFPNFQRQLHKLEGFIHLCLTLSKGYSGIRGCRFLSDLSEVGGFKLLLIHYDFIGREFVRSAELIIEAAEL